jgi:hypothetical protein
VATLSDALSIIDYNVVVDTQRGRLDEGLVRDELAALAVELLDHDIARRSASVFP